MPYREKVAWLSLIAMAVAFGPYLTLMTISPPTGPLPNLPALSFFAATVAVQLVILGVGHLWLRISSPQDARVPADERDRAIARRSLGAAYYTLLTGMVLVGIMLPFTSGGWMIINAAIAGIVLAEVVHYAVAVWSYRRGWHD
jgi:hypothetical protein